jgi:hypothetical protein
LLNRRWLCRSQTGVQQMVSGIVNTSVWTDGLAKVRPVILLAPKSHHTKRSTSCNGTWWINWDFYGFIIPLSKSLRVHCVKTQFSLLNRSLVCISLSCTSRRHRFTVKLCFVFSL